MTTLISFLGRSPKDEGGYRTTAYEFVDGVDEPTSFFGYNLLRRIKPERFVVLGTSGSMWDHLFERDLNLEDALESERLQLMDDVKIKQVQQAQLDTLQPLLAKHLGIEVALKIIPNCTNEAEQVSLIRTIAEQVSAQQNVHLDITHGFRTLPMLGLLSALYIREVKDVQIEEIWYGEYDPDTQKAKAQSLKGLLHITDWLGALTSYKKDGDYGVFASLMGASAHHLQEASFYERVGNTSQAKQKLSSWHIADDATDSEPASLFSQELERRIAWHKKGNTPEHEARLANEYLARKDYLRAAIFGLESLISREVYTQKLADDYQNRKEIGEQLRNNPNFRELNRLRNAMAHGLRAKDKEVSRILSDEDTLNDKLKKLFKQLSVN